MCYKERYCFMFALACRTHLSVDNDSGLHHTHELVVHDLRHVAVVVWHPDFCLAHDGADFHFRHYWHHEIFADLRHDDRDCLVHHYHCVIGDGVHWAELAHFWVRQHRYVHADDAKHTEMIQIQSKLLFYKGNQIFLLTIRRKVFMGRRNVSLILLAGGFFGFELGVWTAQHLIKIPITMTKAIPMQMTAYQFSVTHWATVCSVCLFNKRFFNRTSGPSASTARHFKKTSQ